MINTSEIIDAVRAAVKTAVGGKVFTENVEQLLTYTGAVTHIGVTDQSFAPAGPRMADRSVNMKIVHADEGAAHETLHARLEAMLGALLPVVEFSGRHIAPDTPICRIEDGMASVSFSFKFRDDISAEMDAALMQALHDTEEIT